MAETPILILTIVFLALAILQWQRAVLCARLSLGVSSVFALAALKYPGQSAAEIVEHHRDGLTYLVTVGRGVGLAVFMVSAMLLMREHLAR